MATLRNGPFPNIEQHPPIFIMVIEIHACKDRRKLHYKTLHPKIPGQHIDPKPSFPCPNLPTFGTYIKRA